MPNETERPDDIRRTDSADRGQWAPTGLSWSYDNRRMGFGIVGTGRNLRIECRLPGADTNACLAFAAALARGLDGIAHRASPARRRHDRALRPPFRDGVRRHDRAVTDWERRRYLERI